MDDQGEFVDPLDGTDHSYPITPVFRCVEKSGNTYTAWFGYVNENDNNIYITGSGENIMIGTELGTPPTKFEQGNFTYVFSAG